MTSLEIANAPAAMLKLRRVVLSALIAQRAKPFAPKTEAWDCLSEAIAIDDELFERSLLSPSSK